MYSRSEPGKLNQFLKSVDLENAIKFSPNQNPIHPHLLIDMSLHEIPLNRNGSLTIGIHGGIKDKYIRIRNQDMAS